MKPIYGSLPPKKIKCIVTVGVFDGVHRGHTFILNKLKDEAEKKKVSPIVITFNRPPEIILSHKFLGYLTDTQDKLKLIRNLGMRHVWVLNTTNRLLNYSARDFFSYILENLSVSEFVVGEDFRFGKEQKDVEYLKNICKEFNIGVKTVRKKRIREKTVSSTLIRNFIRQGKIKEANYFLGREYVIKGKIIRGRGVGTDIGFPTANICYNGYVIPAKGVYAASFFIGVEAYPSAVNIGIRPTFISLRNEFHNKGIGSLYNRRSIRLNMPKVHLEAHIINFNRMILGKTAKVVFLEKIRQEKKFSSVKRLVERIKEDALYVLKKFPLSCQI